MFSSSENTIFHQKIEKLRGHGTSRLGTYNCRISQHQNLIHSENKIQICCTTLIGGISGIDPFLHRKVGPKIANVWIPWPLFVVASPLVMLLRFGVTTLRAMSLPKSGRERAASGPRQARKNIRNCSKIICLSKMFDVEAPAKMQSFPSENQKIRVTEPHAWEHITFLFPNVKT